LYPNNHRHFAIAVFYVPSLFFWGSCLMKDSITLSALGGFFILAIICLLNKANDFLTSVQLIVSSYLLFTLKPYILISFFACYFFMDLPNI